MNLKTAMVRISVIGLVAILILLGILAGILFMSFDPLISVFVALGVVLIAMLFVYFFVMRKIN